MKAVKEVGLRKLVRFGWTTLAYLVYHLMVFPPLRRLFVIVMGGKVGGDCVLDGARFMNMYRTGFPGFRVGKECFIGHDVLIDLAGKVILEDQVTVATRAMIISHMNVGMRDHPLQPYFPSVEATTRIGRGAFIGVGAIILAGVTIGECSFVAAGAVVTKDVPPWTLVGGVPARVLRPIKVPGVSGG